MSRVRVQVLLLAGSLLAIVGLMVPAIAKVREAAARAKCNGHHKQVALALYNYERCMGELPTGTVFLPNTTPDQRLSWMSSIVPFIESMSHQHYPDTKSPPDSSHNVVAVRFVFPYFICPSSNIDPFSADAPPVTHIVAVSGVGPDAASLPAEHPRAGLIGIDRAARIDPKFGDIPDGTSNTLMIAEIGGEAGPWARGGWGTLRDFDPAAWPYIGRGRTFGGFHIADRKWYKPNHYGMTAAMADGSVGFVSDKVASEVLEALATKAGGEPLAADW